MKNKLAICAIILFLFGSLIAQEPQRVAVLNFEPEERAARTQANNLMHARRGDFINIFDELDQYKLIDQGRVNDALTDFGISDVRNLNSAMAAQLGEELEADILVWGSISDVSATESRIIANIMSVRSQNINQVRFNARKRRNDRRDDLETELVQKIGELTGGEINRLFDIGEQQLDSENYTAARQTFERIVQIEPQNSEALYFLGYLTFMLDDYESSVDYCEAALEISPDDTRVLNNLVEALIQVGRHTCAITTLEQLAQVDQDETAWLRIAEIYFDIHDEYMATDALRKAVEVNPESEEARYRLGVVLFDNHEIEESIPHLEYIAELNPEDDLINRKLTSAYLRTDQLGSAIESYRRQIERNPENVTAYLNLAGALRTKDNNEEALEALNKLADIERDNPTVFIRLADVHLALDNMDEADRYAQRAQQLDPENHEPYALLAQINQVRGYQQYEDFLEYEKKAQDAFGAEANRLIDMRDQARSQANQLFQQADQHLTSALQYAPGPPVVRDIEARKNMLERLISETRSTFFD